ncbi:MAG: hypothetical protein HY707_09440 [Ignavibacteriae bacterium]|nr:hypothetical protein [Ignavibacteriota bacterium]
MENKNKIRVVCASRPLRAVEAKKFVERFKGNFEGRYVFSGKYLTEGEKVRNPLYYVVWIPPDDLPLIRGHEMHVEREKCFTSVTKIRQIHLRD